MFRTIPKGDIVSYDFHGAGVCGALFYDDCLRRLCIQECCPYPKSGKWKYYIFWQNSWKSGNFHRIRRQDSGVSIRFEIYEIVNSF